MQAAWMGGDEGVGGLWALDGAATLACMLLHRNKASLVPPRLGSQTHSS